MMMMMLIGSWWLMLCVQFFEQFVRPWLAFAVVSAAPFVLIAVCNCLIVVSLLRRRRKTTLRLSCNSQHEQHLVQLTVMCVAASALFLVCSLPSIVLLIGKPYWNVPEGENPAYQVISLHHIFQLHIA